MNNYSISIKEVRRKRYNEYTDMVENGSEISNWSATHMPYSNNTIEEALKEKEEREGREEELLNSVLDFKSKEEN